MELSIDAQTIINQAAGGIFDYSKQDIESLDLATRSIFLERLAKLIIYFFEWTGRTVSAYMLQHALDHGGEIAFGDGDYFVVLIKETTWYRNRVQSAVDAAEYNRVCVGWPWSTMFHIPLFGTSDTNPDKGLYKTGIGGNLFQEAFFPIENEDQDFVYAFGMVEGYVFGEYLASDSVWVTTTYLHSIYSFWPWTAPNNKYSWNPLPYYMAKAEAINVIEAFPYSMRISNYITPTIPMCIPDLTY